MKVLVALSLLTFVAVCSEGKTATQNSLTGLDLKKADGSSYCTPKPCKVPANTNVKIVFKLVVATKASDLIFTARIGKSENKKVFENYNACVSGTNVVLQKNDCKSKTLNPGIYTGSVTAIISTAKTNGKFIIGERTGKFVSQQYSINVV